MPQPPNHAGPEVQQSASADLGTEREEAEKLLSKAEQHYQAGDLRGALELLRQCYGGTHDPNLLFNIAQVLRDLKDCSGAVQNYRRYVREAPNGERVPDAKSQIIELERGCGATQPPKRKPDPPAQHPPVPLPNAHSRSEFWSTIGWTSCGASVLTAAAATYFGIETQSAKSDIEQVQQRPRFQASDLETRLDDFYRDRKWAVGFGLVSGLTAAVGLYLLIVVSPEQRQRSRVRSASVSGRSFDLQVSF